MENNKEKYQTTIIDYGYDGEGIGKLNGKVCFIPYTIKGELVEFKIIEDKKDFCKCSLLDVLHPSNDRISPLCPYFSKCGGCAYQHINYKKELEIKKELLKNQLQKIDFHGDIEIVASPKEYNYRNKIKIFLENGKLGLKERKSNKICEIKGCKLVKNLINNAINILKNFVKNNNHFKSLSNIVIRQEEEQCLVNFFVKRKIEKKIYFQIYDKLGENYGIFETFNNQTSYICGIEKLKSLEFGLTCYFSALSFHQVNNDVCNLLYKKISDEIEGKNIINCYSGNGVLSGILSKKCLNIEAIELGDKEHQEAEDLKQINFLNNLTNIHGDCSKEILRLKEDFDTIIVDPPRNGLSRIVAERINSKKFKKFIYVSCNSATLVRDLKLMTNYKIDKVMLFDMFAKTGEYETLVILSKI